MGNIYSYDSANNIDVDDITTNSDNRIILRRLQRNSASDTNNKLYIEIVHYEDGVVYVPEGVDDMRWLGYFIGKNEHLQMLFISSIVPPSGASVRDVIEPFFRGVSCNKSIRTIEFISMDLLGGEVFTMLGSFFQNNHNLTNIKVFNCDFGDEGCRLFALAIGSNHNLTEINIEECNFGDEGGRFLALAIGSSTTLQHVELQYNDISEEGMVDIIIALPVHRHLKHLHLTGNHLDKNGCVALATLLRSATELQCLNLSYNDINDEGIETLVPALATCSHLKDLRINNNPSITTRGWQSLGTILEAPNSSLEKFEVSKYLERFDIEHRNIVDDRAEAKFAKALTNNRRLKEFHLPPLSEDGLQAISKLLCDTTNVNATFLSNHLLHDLGKNQDSDTIIEPLLDLNRRGDKKEVAAIKILQTHEDFDMLPFFQWEFKVLPMVLGWLERASECDMPDDFEPNIEGRKLSTIYQFVRGMPVLYVETRRKKRMRWKCATIIIFALLVIGGTDTTSCTMNNNIKNYSSYIKPFVDLKLRDMRKLLRPSEDTVLVAWLENIPSTARNPFDDKKFKDMREMVKNQLQNWDLCTLFINTVYTNFIGWLENRQQASQQCALIELQQGFGYWNERGELILEADSTNRQQQRGSGDTAGDEDDARFVQKFHHNNGGDDDDDSIMAGNGDEDEHDSNDEGYDGNDYPEDDASFGLGDPNDSDYDDYCDADATYGYGCDNNSDDEDDESLNNSWRLDFRNRYVSKDTLNQFNVGGEEGEEEETGY